MLVRWRARRPPNWGDAASRIDPSGAMARSMALRNGRSGARLAPNALSVGPDPTTSLATRSTTRSVSLTAKSAAPSRVPPFAPRSAAGSRSLAPPMWGSPPSRRKSAISRPRLRSVGKVPPLAVGRSAAVSARDGANAHASPRISRSEPHSRRVRERSSYVRLVAIFTVRESRANLLGEVPQRADSQSERSSRAPPQTTGPP